ncbi:hypothetical protein THAOC_07449 [Thalassiosira oceanica]|uniref:Uncharacterized protein n=1 Tax=Thalassiosira oceanica TaxID=159749 RepID=K0T0C5_THAOC|nr:hypothetical protein THAOC_07449 [Thalassiosira oceanica]|eukprot:EJK71140.1 hypothetical protein THAOC_07449 [Thalassiosira oceanica]
MVEGRIEVLGQGVTIFIFPAPPGPWPYFLLATLSRYLPSARYLYYIAKYSSYGIVGSISSTRPRRRPLAVAGGRRRTAVIATMTDDGSRNARNRTSVEDRVVQTFGLWSLFSGRKKAVGGEES